MIEHVVEVVAAVAEPVLVSVAEAGAAPLPGHPGARIVVDQFRDAGPLAGLHAGLEAAPTPWVLAVACDMPQLTAGALRTLLAARTPEADAVVARSPDERLHPLCAAYHRRTLQTVEAHLAAGRFALHAVLEHLAVHSVELSTTVLRNVNTPADLP